MGKDIVKTKVKFKILQGEVVAIFPDEIADSRGNIMSYMRMGQPVLV